MQVSKLDKAQTVKIVKTLLYLAASAAIGGAISILTSSPELFGIYTPIANLVLVTIKQFLTEPK